MSHNALLYSFSYSFKKPPFYKGRFGGVLEYLPKPPQPLLAKEGNIPETECLLPLLLSLLK